MSQRWLRRGSHILLRFARPRREERIAVAYGEAKGAYPDVYLQLRYREEGVYADGSNATEA